MKKILILGLAVLSVGLLASQVMALQGPHNVGVAGRCDYCHIPHASGGDRLWAETPAGPATNWGNNKIGQLCYSCHDGTFGGASNMGFYLYADNTAHGPLYDAIPPLPDGTQGNLDSTDGQTVLNASLLPYTSATNPLIQAGDQAIQCTSCHTVHTEDQAGERVPYLRIPAAGDGTRSSNCEMCHRRGEATANGMKGANNIVAYPLATVSLHPVDISATAATEGARLDAATAASMTTPLVQADSTYQLGGKLSNGDAGNMECATCHAIHGNELASTTAIGNFKLAIANYPAVIATSALCDGCHADGLAAATSVVTGMSDHPIDSNSGTYEVNYPLTGGHAAPWSWVSGTATAEVVCSSCHDMHGGLQAGADGSDPTQGNDLVGRLRRMGGDAVDWCYSCHTNASPNNHHSHTGNLNVAQGDAMTSILVCGDCHGGGGGSTAHNATGGFFATRNFGNGNHVANINWCMYCHAVNPTTILTTWIDPTALGPATTIQADNATGYRQLHTDGATPITPAGNGSDQGSGTHALGFDLGFNATMTNVKTDAWANAFNPFAGSIDGVADNLSRYGGGAGSEEMTCESCHNIIGNVGYTGGTTEADGDAGWLANLLLEAYYDDGEQNCGGANAGATLSALCIACHYDSVGGTAWPAGTHQTTAPANDVITAAQDNERAITTLVTTAGDGTYANAAGAPNDCGYYNTDAMDCDSCHRAHDADEDGVGAGGATAGTYAAGISISGDDWVIEVCGGGAEYSSTFCTQCHTY